MHLSEKKIFNNYFLNSYLNKTWGGRIISMELKFFIMNEICYIYLDYLFYFLLRIIIYLKFNKGFDFNIFTFDAL